MSNVRAVSESQSSVNVYEASAPDRKPSLHWPLVKSPMIRLAIVTVIMVGLATLFLQVGAELIGTTNQNPLKSDQMHNMKLARIASERAEWNVEKGIGKSLWQWMPHYTEGVVQPFWPRVAATFSSDDDDEFFTAGKRWNLGFSVLFISAAGILLALRWSILATINFVIIVGFGAFLPRAVYFQPEPLYYAFFLLSFICALGLIKKNALWLYLLFGIFSAFGYLTKGSMLPLIAAFFGVTTYRFLAAVIPRLFGGVGLRPKSRWIWQNHLFGTILFAFAFLFINAPSMSYRHERFGSPTHSFPSYWMWMDSFEESYAWMATHNSTEKLDALTADTKPSARNYFKTHDLATASMRLTDGTWMQVKRFFAPRKTNPAQSPSDQKPWRETLPARGWHLLLIGLPALVLIGLGWWQKFHIRRKTDTTVNLSPWFEIGPQAIFVCGSFAMYAMLHGWYTQVGDGDRFMMAWVAPLAFCLLALGEKALRRLRRSADCATEAPTENLAKIATIFYIAAQVTLLMFLAYRLWQITIAPVFS